MKLQLKAAAKGKSTAEILTMLVSENQSLVALFAFQYQQPMLLQQRLAFTSDENAIVAKAIALRASSQLPFWEAVMVSCFGERRDFTRLLQEAKYHQFHSDTFQRISRADVLAGRLGELLNSQPAGYQLSFSSKIELDRNDVRHLALLDFHCPETEENDRLVSEVCKQLFQSKTIVFASGESYHALGLVTLDQNELRDFLTRSLLFAPIVDSRYVAHQLIEGSCALRLSSSGAKPKRPLLKFFVENERSD